MSAIDIDVVSDGPDDTGSDGNDGICRPGAVCAPQLHLSMMAGTRLSLPDAIVARSVPHMVREILARMRREGADRIHRLRIFAHGRPGEMFIGGGLRGAS